MVVRARLVKVAAAGRLLGSCNRREDLIVGICHGLHARLVAQGPSSHRAEAALELTNVLAGIVHFGGTALNEATELMDFVKNRIEATRLGSHGRLVLRDLSCQPAVLPFPGFHRACEVLVPSLVLVLPFLGESCLRFLRCHLLGSAHATTRFIHIVREALFFCGTLRTFLFFCGTLRTFFGFFGGHVRSINRSIFTFFCCATATLVAAT